MKRCVLVARGLCWLECLKVSFWRMGSPVDEESIMKSLKAIVHTWPNPARSRGIPVMNVVKALYQEDPRIKEYVKDTLQSSVLDLMKKDRDRFLVLYGSTVFPASGGKVSGGDMGAMRSFTVDEVRDWLLPIRWIASPLRSRDTLDMLKSSLLSPCNRFGSIAQRLMRGSSSKAWSTISRPLSRPTGVGVRQARTAQSSPS